MGCSTNNKSAPQIKYTISYCSLLPVKKNIYKIILTTKEEVVKKKERKFFDQIGRNREKAILDFCQNKNFEQNTLFYIYSKSQPQLKNLYQMLNLIPNDIPNLQKIFLLSTEKLKNFPNFFIERKTQNLAYNNFIGFEIDLNDMVNIFEDMNDINITEDNVKYEDDAVIDEEEEVERKDEIYINGVINEKYAKVIKKFFLDNEEIIKVFISEIKIEDKNSFAELITFFWNQDIKIFSVYDTNINDSDSIIFYSIIEILEKNYSIRSLDLHNCNLNDFNINDLTRAISDKRLRYLDLSKNGITVEGASILSQFLTINKTLQKLNISNNSTSSFKSEGIEYITNALISSPNIKYVDFSGMNITGSGEFIGDLINENKSIENLILKNNTLNANDFWFIFDAVKENKILKVIDISFNDMGGNGALERIRDAIKENETLEELRMDKININNDNYKIIFDGIENNKNISNYSLSYNLINLKIVIDFFMRLTHVKNLKFIPSENNNNKKLTLDDKKILDKCKNERPDLIVTIN